MRLVLFAGKLGCRKPKQSRNILQTVEHKHAKHLEVSSFILVQEAEASPLHDEPHHFQSRLVAPRVHLQRHRCDNEDGA